jgi:hypothetical protein
LSAAPFSAPLTLRSRATVETTESAATAQLTAGLPHAIREQVRRFGVETELGGLLSNAQSRRGALKLKLDRVEGSRPETAGSVAYDQSWKVGVAQLGMNVKMLRATFSTAGEFQPSFGFTWKWSL